MAKRYRKELMLTTEERTIIEFVASYYGLEVATCMRMLIRQQCVAVVEMLKEMGYSKYNEEIEKVLLLL